MVLLPSQGMRVSVGKVGGAQDGGVGATFEVPGRPLIPDVEVIPLSYRDFRSTPAHRG